MVRGGLKRKYGRHGLFSDILSGHGNIFQNQTGQKGVAFDKGICLNSISGVGGMFYQNMKIILKHREMQGCKWKGIGELPHYRQLIYFRVMFSHPWKAKDDGFTSKV